MRDGPPTTITGELTGVDPIAARPRAVNTLLRGAFLVGPLLMLLLVLVAYEIDQEYKVVAGFTVSTQFVADNEGVLIEGTMNKVRNCEFVSVAGRSASGDVAGVTFMDRRLNEAHYSRPLGPQKFGPWYVEGKRGEGITLSAVHRCHFLWPHFEDIGAFVVGQP